MHHNSVNKTEKNVALIPGISDTSKLDQLGKEALRVSIVASNSPSKRIMVVIIIIIYFVFALGTREIVVGLSPLDNQSPTTQLGLSHTQNKSGIVVNQSPTTQLGLSHTQNKSGIVVNQSFNQSAILAKNKSLVSPDYSQQILLALKGIEETIDKANQLPSKIEIWTGIFLGILLPLIITREMDRYRIKKRIQRSKRLLLTELKDIRIPLDQKGTPYRNYFFSTGAYDSLFTSGFLQYLEESNQDYISQLYYRLKEHNNVLQYLGRYADNIDDSRPQDIKKWTDILTRYSEYLVQLEKDASMLLDICQINLSEKEEGRFRLLSFWGRRLFSSLRRILT